MNRRKFISTVGSLAVLPAARHLPAIPTQEEPREWIVDISFTIMPLPEWYSIECYPRLDFKQEFPPDQIGEGKLYYLATQWLDRPTGTGLTLRTKERILNPMKHWDRLVGCTNADFWLDIPPLAAIINRVGFELA